MGTEVANPPNRHDREMESGERTDQLSRVNGKERSSSIAFSLLLVGSFSKNHPTSSGPLVVPM